MSSTGAALGSPGLSVRGDGNRKIARPSPGQSVFAESLDYEKLGFDSEARYRAVSEGDSRRIETVADAIDAHGDYIDEKDGASIVLKDRSSDEVMVLPYSHRWTADYRDMVYAKLKGAERRLEQLYRSPVPVTLVSLTAHQTDDEGRPRPPAEVLRDLLDGWDLFRRAIDRSTEGWRTEYIRVVEPHESGYPHLHVAIFGKADPTLADKVLELWVDKYGIGGEAAHRDAVTANRGRSAQLKNVAAYLMKYLSKTTVRESGEAPEFDGYDAFSALLWVTGKRQYSASAALSEAMKSPDFEGDPDGHADWIFVGVGYGLEPGRYSGEDAESIVAQLEPSGRWRPPPLFGPIDGDVRAFGATR